MQFSGLPLGGPHWSAHQALHIAFSSGVRPELADSHLLSGTAGVVGSAGVAGSAGNAGTAGAVAGCSAGAAAGSTGTSGTMGSYGCPANNPPSDLASRSPLLRKPELSQSWGACTARGAFRCAERRPAATSEAAARPAGLDALLLAALLSPCVDGNRAWRCVLLVSL